MPQLVTTLRGHTSLWGPECNVFQLLPSSIQATEGGLKANYANLTPTPGGMVGNSASFVVSE